MSSVDRTYGESAAQSPPAGASGVAGARPAAAGRQGRDLAGEAVPRRVRLTVARVDPWSVTKLSFLLSVAVGVVIVVATALVWTVLNGMGVFGDVNGVLRDILGSTDIDLYDYVGLGKVVSLATVVAVVDVVLLTALATLGAFLYNVSAALVGGLRVTLSDD
ncbi:DUF3566 domain-containing protein [Kineococcus glutinatus]|uniref:DUF3566 domain-containing protein n=1 Tax=Kineococcus glutinatus TaxID=1070872 RepID=A0ABP9HGC4_9ACTN